MSFRIRSALVILLIFTYIFKLGFSPRKAEQRLQGMELQEKEAQNDLSIHEISSERTYN